MNAFIKITQSFFIFLCVYGSTSAQNAIYSTGSASGYDMTEMYGTTLPVELLYFNATPERAKVYLKWETATEINNHYFTLEKSKDAISFESFAIIPAMGNSILTTYYSQTDAFPYNGLSYYRLKQTDFDGKSEYFPVVPVNFKSAHYKDVRITIDYQAAEIYAYFSNMDNTVAEIIMVDMQGRELFKEKIEIAAKPYQFPINSALAPGIYLIRTVTDSGEQFSQKIVYGDQ